MNYKKKYDRKKRKEKRSTLIKNQIQNSDNVKSIKIKSKAVKEVLQNQVIDYERLEQCYVNGRFQYDKEKKKREEEEKLRERDDWRKRVGYKSYEDDEDGWIKTIKININAMQCICRSLSGKEEYRRDGLWASIMRYLIEYLFFKIISLAMFAWSLVCFACTLSPITIWVIDNIVLKLSSNESFQVLSSFLACLNMANNLLFFFIGIISVFFGYVFNDISIEVEKNNQKRSNDVQWLFGLFARK